MYAVAQDVEEMQEGGLERVIFFAQLSNINLKSRFSVYIFA